MAQVEAAVHRATTETRPVPAAAAPKPQRRPLPEMPEEPAQRPRIEAAAPDAVTNAFERGVQAGVRMAMVLEQQFPEVEGLPLVPVQAERVAPPIVAEPVPVENRNQRRPREDDGPIPENQRPRIDEGPQEQQLVPVVREAGDQVGFQRRRRRDEIEAQLPVVARRQGRPRRRIEEGPQEQELVPVVREAGDQVGFQRRRRRDEIEAQLPVVARRQGRPRRRIEEGPLPEVRELLGQLVDRVEQGHNRAPHRPEFFAGLQDRMDRREVRDVVEQLVQRLENQETVAERRRTEGEGQPEVVQRVDPRAGYYQAMRQEFRRRGGRALLKREKEAWNPLMQALQNPDTPNTELNAALDQYLQFWFEGGHQGAEYFRRYGMRDLMDLLRERTALDPDTIPERFKRLHMKWVRNNADAPAVRKAKGKKK